MNKRLAYLFIILGSLIAALGIVFIFMYIWEAIISRSGDPDQSLLFWYLPIMFLGVIASVGGLRLLLRGINQVRNMRKDST